MRLRQSLRQIAVALVGDDHRGAGLGNAEIGASDADIGGEELAPQYGARFGNERRRLVEGASGIELFVRLAKAVGDLLLHQMDRRGNDMARILFADLDDVLAE